MHGFLPQNHVFSEVLYEVQGVREIAYFFLTLSRDERYLNMEALIGCRLFRDICLLLFLDTHAYTHVLIFQYLSFSLSILLEYFSIIRATNRSN